MNYQDALDQLARETSRARFRLGVERGLRLALPSAFLVAAWAALALWGLTDRLPPMALSLAAAGIVGAIVWLGLAARRRWRMPTEAEARARLVRDLLPLAFTRPLTGAGSRAMLVELLQSHGPDSFIGNTASIMMGSSETTFYVLTIYFGAVNIKKIRHTLAACLLADLVGVVIAIGLGYLLFGTR